MLKEENVIIFAFQSSRERVLISFEAFRLNLLVSRPSFGEENFHNFPEEGNNGTHRFSSLLFSSDTFFGCRLEIKACANDDDNTRHNNHGEEKSPKNDNS